MNTQEKKEALVQAVEEIAGKEAAYWEGNPKMQETFQNCYVSTAKTTTKFLESGEAYVFTGDIAAMWLRDSSAQVVHYLPYLKEYPILKDPDIFYRYARNGRFPQNMQHSSENIPE